MDEIQRVKDIEIRFDAINRTVTIEKFPVEMWSHIMNCASLFNSLDRRAYEVEMQTEPQPSPSTKENLKWLETLRRKIKLVHDKFRQSMGEPSFDSLDQLDEHAVEQWVASELAYVQLMQDKPKLAEYPVEDGVYSHVYRARLLMLELMRQISYASGTITGLSRKNHNNQSQFAVNKLRNVPKLSREIIKHLVKFETAYQKSQTPTQDVDDPMERAFR